MAEGESYRIEIPVTVQDHTEPALSQAQSRVSRFDSTIENTERNLNRMNRSRWQLVLHALDRASSTIGHVSSFARRIAGKSYQITIRALDLATRPLRAIGRLATSTLGLLGAGAGVAGGIVWPVKLADDLEIANIGFETMLGSAKKANNFMKKVQNFAIATPFSQKDVVNNAKNMMVRGFSQKEIIPYLTKIGNVTAAMGTGAEGIDRIVLALGQMKALGKVSSQDMNQLTDAGVQAWKYLADASGKSIAQVRQDVQKGKMDSLTAINAIMKGLGKFDGQMQKTANKTVGGLWSQILDVFSVNVFTKWGQGIQKAAIPGLKSINNWLGNNKDTISKWGDMFEQAGYSITHYAISKVDQLKNVMSDLVNSQAWKNADTFGEKIHLAWDNLIAQPFAEWYNSKGKAKIQSVASNIGSDIGSFIGSGLMAMFGAGGGSGGGTFVSAGSTAASSFLKGFSDNFNLRTVIKAAISNLANVNKNALIGQGSIMGALLADAIAIAVVRKVGAMFGVGFFYNLVKKGYSKLRNRGGGRSGPRRGSGSRGSETPPTPPASETTSTGNQRRTETSSSSSVPRSQITDRHGNPVSSSTTRQATEQATEQTARRGGMLARLGRVGGKAKGVLKRLPGLNLLFGGIDFATSRGARNKTRAVGGFAGGWAGSLGGAAAGAAIGSVVPVVGTAVGGVIGGIAGGIGGDALGRFLGGKGFDLAKKLKFGQAKDKVAGFLSDFGKKIKKIPGIASDHLSGLGSKFSGWFSAAKVGAATAISNLPGRVSGIISRIAPSASSVFSGLKETFSSWGSKLGGAVTSAFNSAKSVASKLASNGAVQKGINVAKKIGSFLIHGSHASGLNRVPFDGYMAELHKDEAVLTAREAKVYRQIGLNQTVNSSNVISLDKYRNDRYLSSIMATNGRQSSSVINRYPVSSNSSTEEKPQVSITPVSSGGGSKPSHSVTIDSVNLGGVNLSFDVQGGSDKEVIDAIKRHVHEVADTLSYEIAKALEEVFQNLPGYSA